MVAALCVVMTSLCRETTHIAPYNSPVRESMQKRCGFLSPTAQNSVRTEVEGNRKSIEAGGANEGSCRRNPVSGADRGMERLGARLPARPSTSIRRIP